MATEGIGLVEATAPKTTTRAIFYSYYPVAAEFDAALAARVNGLEPDVLLVGSLTGAGTVHPKLLEAIDLAKETGATTILIPGGASLGPIKPQEFLEDLLPVLQEAGIRIRAIPPDNCDTGDPRFMDGIRWAVDSADRAKAAKVRKKYPKCQCHHGVGPPGTPQHNRIGGEISVCYAPHCGCPIYRGQDERLMKTH